MFNDKPLIHIGILGMKWGVRRRASGQVRTSVRGKVVNAVTSVRGKKTNVIGGKTKKSKRTPEETKKAVAIQKKKKAAAMIKEQNAQDVKRLTSHLMTGYLTMNASKWANEAATPKAPSYNEAYGDWLLNG